jgi:hypothetical protein
MYDWETRSPAPMPHRRELAWLMKQETHASGSIFCGVPLREMTREELMAVASYGMRRWMDAAGYSITPPPQQ